jgi:hypothetical protein
VRNREPVRRQDKIRLLNALKSGKRTVRELKPLTVELWCQHSYDPGVFTNEATGEVITAAQMQEKQRTQGEAVLFITILNYTQDPL